MRSARRSQFLRTGRLLIGAAAIAVARPGAGAEPTSEQAARAAYERGTGAFERGEFATAAAEFARADEIAPNPVALESALKAVLRADDPALGMNLVERAGRVEGNRSLASLAKVARERFAGRAGELTIVCPTSSACSAKIDSAPVPVGAGLWYAAGRHQIELAVSGVVERREIVVVAGASVEVKPLSVTDTAPAPQPRAAAPPARPRPPAADAAPTDASGLSPAWFWVAAGATVVLAGATAVSGVDAVNKHDAYLANPTDETESTGRGAETRTNVLLGVAGAAAVTTAALGLFAVRWSAPAATAHAGLAITPHGVHLNTEVRF
jgi:hypothetical protein